MASRQGVRRVIRLKNKNAKYKVKYTYRKQTAAKNNKSTKYTYASKVISFAKKYSYRKA